MSSKNIVPYLQVLFNEIDKTNKLIKEIIAGPCNLISEVDMKLFLKKCNIEECARKVVTNSGSTKIVKVTGTYGKIKFWGKNKELHTYLNKICRSLNLWDAQLLVKYIFVLAHEDLDNEYFVEIYFPIPGSGR